jgi:hypothetical protein
MLFSVQAYKNTSLQKLQFYKVTRFTRFTSKQKLQMFKSFEFPIVTNVR